MKLTSQKKHSAKDKLQGEKEKRKNFSQYAPCSSAHAVCRVQPFPKYLSFPKNINLPIIQ